MLEKTPPGSSIELTIKLRRQNPLPDVNNGDVRYTLEGLRQKCGAAAADIALVEGVLRAANIEVVSSDLGTRAVKAKGDARFVAALFRVSLWEASDSRASFRIRSGELSIPAELHNIVVAVFGLDSRQMAYRAVTAKEHRPIPSPEDRPWFLPNEILPFYGFADRNCSGQTIGLLEFGGKFVESDLKMFCELTHLTTYPIVKIVDAGQILEEHRDDPGEVSEVMVDVEMIAGSCPGATIAIYFSSFTEKGWIDALDAAIHDSENRPSVLSISWGCAEGAKVWTEQAVREINECLQEAALLGTTVCVCSGDDGAGDQIQDGRAHVHFPAASPYVLGVGGTILSKRDGVERGWTEGTGIRETGGGSTGGGISALTPRPTWQDVDISLPTSAREGGGGRCVPDVSANAARETGYFTVFGGAPWISGGTSTATPLWAAVICQINSSLKDKTVGYFTPKLYRPAPDSKKALGSLVCNDVVKGDNSVAKVRGYKAGRRYDLVTGWGSPKGDALSKWLKSMAEQRVLSEPSREIQSERQ